MLPQRIVFVYLENRNLIVCVVQKGLLHDSVCAQYTASQQQFECFKLYMPQGVAVLPKRLSTLACAWQKLLVCLVILRDSSMHIH